MRTSFVPQFSTKNSPGPRVPARPLSCQMTGWVSFWNSLHRWRVGTSRVRTGHVEVPKATVGMAVQIGN